MKHALLALFLTFPLISEAAITAPVSVDAGQLAVAKSDVPAVWTVYPAQYQTAIYVADEGATLIFASPDKGEVTLIAATLVEGKIELNQHVLYNGVPAPEPEVVPEPEPKPTPAPQPPPEPEKTPLEKAVEGAKDFPAEDVNALADTFESIVSGIDRGTINTPIAARETFRAIWANNAGKVNPQAITAMGTLITEISNQIDNSSLATIRRDYSYVAKTLKEIKPLPKEESPPPTEKKPETPITNQNCPNGNCPQVQPIRGGFFR